MHKICKDLKKEFQGSNAIVVSLESLGVMGCAVYHSCPPPPVQKNERHD